MNTIQSLDNQANTTVPLVNSQKLPTEYFKLGAEYLRLAGQARKNSDLKNAYLNLKKYVILVTQRLPQHPDIQDPQFRNEFEFNKRKVAQMQVELETLMKNIISSDTSGGRSLPPPPGKSSGPPPIPSHLLKQKSQQPQQPQQPQQQSSWSFGSLFGMKSTSAPTTSLKSESESNIPPKLPPRRDVAPQLPPRRDIAPQLPPRNDVVPFENRTVVYNEDVTDLTIQERVAFKTIGKLAYNDHVQTELGNTVARVALNDEVQEKVAQGVKNIALNEEYQEGIGNAIAENTDNTVLKKIATNKMLQKAVGTSIAKTVGNKELQVKAGHAVASIATNKQVQQAAAKGFMGALKVGIKGAKFGGKTALTAGKLYLESRNHGNDDSPQEEPQE